MESFPESAETGFKLVCFPEASPTPESGIEPKSVNVYARFSSWRTQTVANHSVPTRHRADAEALL